jgi:hypothetical protein
MTQPDPDFPICRFLRTKSMYVRGRQALAAVAPSATRCYWCVATMSAVGPDDRQATPEGCRAGRGCFQPLQDEGPFNDA